MFVVRCIPGRGRGDAFDITSSAARRRLTGPRLHGVAVDVFKAEEIVMHEYNIKIIEENYCIYIYIVVL